MNEYPHSIPSGHQKNILLVEDDPTYVRPIKRWLKKEGYQVISAGSLGEARQALETRHFHAAVIDINLDSSDDNNQDGLELLPYIQENNLSGLMPSIILTSHATQRNILRATQKYNARFLLKDPEYGKELKEVLGQIFKQIAINFDLIYEVDSDNLLPVIANEIKWADDIRPSVELLTEQIQDIFGKLFVRANKLYIRKMKPGLTGAAVLRAEPTLKYGLTPAQVIKIGRRDKMETESQNYENYVKDYLPMASVQTSTAYSQHLGGILYTFMGSGSRSFVEFDEFYEKESTGAVIDSLEDLVFNTCRYWYDHRERVRQDLRALYYQALNLDRSRLVERIQSVVPGYDPGAKQLVFPLTDQPIINPMLWMDEKSLDFIQPVFQSITHGDLTGRNIMVDKDRSCWLIDFYRTYPSHILRDFLVLETDIKYRILPCPDLNTFIQLENTLLSGKFSDPEIELDPALSEPVKKAIGVVHALHHIATRISMSVGGAGVLQEEYLRSLLMVTLNVVRLRHIENVRKLQALYSAHLICQELERLSR